MYTTVVSNPTALSDNFPSNKKRLRSHPAIWKWMAGDATRCQALCFIPSVSHSFFVLNLHHLAGSQCPLNPWLRCACLWRDVKDFMSQMFMCHSPSTPMAQNSLWPWVEHAVSSSFCSWFFFPFHFLALQGHASNYVKFISFSYTAFFTQTTLNIQSKGKLPVLL